MSEVNLLFENHREGVVGREIDTYVRPAPEKIDQVRWKFFIKKGGRSGGKLCKERPYFI